MKGHFTKRGNTWTYVVDVGVNPKTGRRKRKSKGGFKTKKDAQIAAAQIQLELSNNTYFEESDTKFQDFAQDWLELYQSTGKVKISTVRVRQHEINNLLPYFAHYKIAKITKKMYQNALIDLSKKFSKTTLEGIHTTGRMIFRKAVELDIIKNDPTQYAIVPQTQKTVEELAHFLKTCKEAGKTLEYEIFTLLSYTGLRVGEMCALKWKDIDFEECTISITKTYYNPNNNTVAYKLLPPKTVTSIRCIEVDPEVLDDLKKLKPRQNELRMKYRDTWIRSVKRMPKRLPLLT